MPIVLVLGPLTSVVVKVAYNTAESLVDGCRDTVQPKKGSILFCDLMFGHMEHSGVYLGNNEIAHLSGDGKIEVVSPKAFIAGGTAVSIYVSCSGTNAVGSSEVATRAKEMAGSSRSYNFLFNNCHQFSAGCLTGDFENSLNFLWMLKDEAKKHLGSDNWRQWDIKLF
jgi:hypothetical protein